MTSSLDDKTGNSIALTVLDWFVIGLAIIGYLAIVLLGVGVWDDLAGAQNAGIPDWFESGMSNPPAGADPAEQRMLAAQEAMAGFASWMFLVAALTGLVTAAGTVAIWRQIKFTRQALVEARRANELVGDSARAQLRAYISIEPNIKFDSRGRFESFEIGVSNTGATPIPMASALITLDGPVTKDDDSQIYEVASDFALGPRSKTTFNIKKQDIPEKVLHRHFYNEDPIEITIDIDYFDIFEVSHQAILSVTRWSSNDKTFAFLENHKFD